MDLGRSHKLRIGNPVPTRSDVIGSRLTRIVNARMLAFKKTAHAKEIPVVFGCEKSVRSEENVHETGVR